MHVGDELARAVFFLSHHAARATCRLTGDLQITPSNHSRTHYDSGSTNRTKFTQTRRQTDISYKQRRKSYKYRIFIQTWRISLHSNELRGASSGQHRYIIPGLNGRPPIGLCSSCPAARSPDCREPRRYICFSAKDGSFPHCPIDIIG